MLPSWHVRGARSPSSHPSPSCRRSPPRTPPALVTFRALGNRRKLTAMDWHRPPTDDARRQAHLAMFERLGQRLRLGWFHLRRVAGHAFETQARAQRFLQLLIATSKSGRNVTKPPARLPAVTGSSGRRRLIGRWRCWCSVAAQDSAVRPVSRTRGSARMATRAASPLQSSSSSLSRRAVRSRNFFRFRETEVSLVGCTAGSGAN